MPVASSCRPSRLRRVFGTTGAGLSLVLLMLGCGGHDYGPTGSITGTLSYKDKPLREGTTVSFMEREKGFLAFGPTDAEGKFEVKSWNDGEMPVGTYTVMIQPPEGPASVSQEEQTPEELLEGNGTAAPVQAAEFPRKYLSFATSDLTFPIKEGENHFDVVLKD